MQEKSIFLAKIQQVKQGKIRKRWGLTEKEEVIAWNYEESSTGLGVFSKLLLDLPFTRAVSRM
jgi:hypothetical protein